MGRPVPIAVLVSGAGTTLDALAHAVERDGLPATIVAVLADRADAPASAVASRHRLPYAVVRMRADPGATGTPGLDLALQGSGAELVVLAGLRSILAAPFVSAWTGRIVNLHPSLLPRHGGPGQYGRKVYETVLASGDRESGATLHLVTADVDAGPVVLQDRFPVTPDDTVETLQAKTQALERRLLFEAIRRFADGEWSLPYAPGAPARRSPAPVARD
jgi:phosphoribosylglycinamide formyltransferase-1